MALGFKSIINGVNPEIVADIGDDVVIIRHNQAPVDGPSGTLAGEAGPGSYLVDRAGKTGYLNTGTLDSPVWTPIGGAGGGRNRRVRQRPNREGYAGCRGRRRAS